MIRVSELTKRYGDLTVVHRLSFELEGGQALALWGPNGAGKTTVVRCLLGLSAYQGRITIGGFDATAQGKKTRSLIGHVPQELSFFDELSVSETLGFSARIRGVSSGRVAELIERFDLRSEAGKPVGSLSGGMKQRLAISIALLADPPVLILDEPTSNLDAASRESVLQMLEDLRRPDRCLLLTSHRIEEVGLLADRVITMESGRAVLECGPDQLAERLGLLVWLHVKVGGDRNNDAVAILRDAGFGARLNSRGVLVEVSAQRKAAALSCLTMAGLGVDDFEVWR